MTGNTEMGDFYVFDCIIRWTKLPVLKMDANADAPKTCILLFGQQELLQTGYIFLLVKK